MSLLEYAPFVAALFAVPQFVPQILRVLRAHDSAGVSWAWATLTCINNAAWFLYFVQSSYPTALIPVASASTLAGVLAIVLTRRGMATPRAALAVAAWTGLVLATFFVVGLAGLGTLLNVAFALQVTPSIWKAYRTKNPTGISRGTWLLLVGEVTCWLTFGLYRGDSRLLVLGVTGIIAGLLMLARTIRRTQPAEPSEPAEPAEPAEPIAQPS